MPITALMKEHGVEDPNNKLTGGKWEDNIGKVSSGGTTPIVEAA